MPDTFDARLSTARSAAAAVLVGGSWPDAAAALTALAVTAAATWTEVRGRGPDALAYPDQVARRLQGLEHLRGALTRVREKVLAHGSSPATMSGFARAHNGACALVCAVAASVALHTHTPADPAVAEWTRRLATHLDLPAPAAHLSGDDQGADETDLWQAWESGSVAEWFADQPNQAAGLLYPPGSPLPSRRHARAVVAAWVAHTLGLPPTGGDQAPLRAPVALAANKGEGGEIRDLVHTPRIGDDQPGFLFLDPAGALTPLADDLVAAVDAQWRASGAAGGMWRLGPRTPANGHHTPTARQLHGTALTGPSLAGAARALFEAVRLGLPHNPGVLVIAGIDPDTTLTGMDGIASKLAAWHRSDPGAPAVLGPALPGHHPATGSHLHHPLSLTDLVDHTTFHLRPLLREALTTPPPLTPALDAALLASRGGGAVSGGGIAWIEPAFTVERDRRHLRWGRLLSSLVSRGASPLGRVVVVTGGPGQGKTTLARNLHTVLLDRARLLPDAPAPVGLPVTVTAAQFHTPDLRDVLSTHLTAQLRTTGWPHLVGEAAAWLAADPTAVLVVDAVDQADHVQAANLLRALDGWAGRAVLIGRPHIAEHPLPDHARLTIADLTIDQASNVISSYLRAAGIPDPTAIEQAATLSRHTAARALHTSPLLVLLHAWWHTWNTNATTPPTQVALYRQLLRALASRDTAHPDIPDHDTADETLAALAAALADRALENPDHPPRGPLDRADLHRRVRDLGYTPADASGTLDTLVARRVLFALPGGLLDTAHPTFIAHLAARGLADALARAARPGHPDNALTRAVENHIDHAAGNPDHDLVLTHLVGLTRHQPTGPDPTPAEALLQLIAGYRKPGKKTKKSLDRTASRDNLRYDRHRTALLALRQLPPPPPGTPENRTGHHITRKSWAWAQWWERDYSIPGLGALEHLHVALLNNLPTWLPEAYSQLTARITDRGTETYVADHLASVLARAGVPLPPAALANVTARITDPTTTASDTSDLAWALTAAGGTLPEAAATALTARITDPTTTTRDATQLARALTMALTAAGSPLPAAAAAALTARFTDPTTRASDTSFLAWTLAAAGVPLPEAAAAALTARITEPATTASDARDLASALTEAGVPLPPAALANVTARITDPTTRTSDASNLASVLARAGSPLPATAAAALTARITNPTTRTIDARGLASALTEAGVPLPPAALASLTARITDIGDDTYGADYLAYALARAGVPLPEAAAAALTARITDPTTTANDASDLASALTEAGGTLPEAATTALTARITDPTTHIWEVGHLVSALATAGTLAGAAADALIDRLVNGGGA